MIEITLKAGEKFPVAATSKYLIIRSAGEQIWLSMRNSAEVAIESSDVIELSGVGDITLINKSTSPQSVKFQISPFKIDAKVQTVSVKSIEEIVKVEMDKDVNIGAVTQSESIPWLMSLTNESDFKPANDNAHLPQVEVSSGQTALLCAANVNRKEVRLSIKGDQIGGVYLGKLGLLTGQGGWLDVGMVDYLSTQGALYAHNPNDQAVTIQILELNRS